jgi:serine protease Do
MRTFFGFVVVTVVLSSVVVGRSADLTELEESAIRAAVDRVAPSVVRIQTVGGRTRVGRVTLGPGPCTGVIVSTDGYVISSSFNFAREPTTILVELPDGSSRPAKLVARDLNRSLVLIKVDLPDGAEPLAVAQAAPDDEIDIGAWAVAVGKTFDAKQPNMSVGIISAVNRVWSKAVQTDAKISPNNYGGPLIGIDGRVIGILAPLSPQSTQAVAGANWYDSGIGFAIPLTHVYSVLDKLKKGEDLHAGLMGINLKGRDQFSVPPTIAAARYGSPAQAAGIEAGDKIIEANGRAVVNQAQLKHVVSPLYAGDKVRLVVMRGDARKEIEFELAAELPPYAHPFLGVLPRRDSEFKQGVTVRYVYPESGAASAGIKAGDRFVVIGKKRIEKRSDIYEALYQSSAGEKIKVEYVTATGEKKTAEVGATALPTAIPGELPRAYEDVPAADDPGVDVGAFQIQLPEFENKCFVYVPDDYNPKKTYGILIWLDRPGQFKQEELLQRWKARCIANDLILMVPQPRERDRWHRDETDFISGALNRILDDYEIDDARTVVHGYRAGGAMAFYLFNSPKANIHAISVVEAPLPAGLTLPSLQPTTRAAVHWVFAKDGDLAKRVSASIRQLREMHYPVTERPIEGRPRYLGGAELDNLMRWIDSLDRI